MAIVANQFDLQGCLETAAQIEADLGRLTAGLTESQFHAPTRTGGWSVGYCIEHLVLTGQAFLPKWDAALHQATRRGAHGAQTFPYAWWQLKILQSVENPSKLKRRTALPFEPRSRQSIEKTVRRFLEMHQELARRLASSRGLDVKGIPVQSPFVTWIHYALGFSFDLALAHERRHLSQAWNIRRQLAGGF